MCPRKNTPWAQFGFESVLIIVSILVAFSIDAWWDSRRAARQTEELISALVLDFETTRSLLAESIATSSDMNDRTAGFLTAVGKKEPATLESLRHSISGAFVKIDFEPSLSAYCVTAAICGLSLTPTSVARRLLTQVGTAKYQLQSSPLSARFNMG